MAILKTFFILAISLALAIALSTKTIHGLGEAADAMPDEYETDIVTPGYDVSMPSMPLRRILRHKHEGDHHGRTSQCTKDNEKCKRHKDNDENNEHQHHKYRCCKKKCMDLSSDSNHCGHCHKKCAYNKQCCRGKCVTLDSNKHCGSCNNRCPKDGKCEMGMCKYA